MTREKKQFLSVADMDAWAAEQNEIARHNAWTYRRELIDYAEERRIDWQTPGGLERARKLRDQDAHSALRRRENHRGGNAPRYNKDVIRQQVRRRLGANPDWKIVTRIVAAGVDPIGGDTAKGVLRAVRRYCHDLRRR
jgi:hypothetical protein